MSDIQVALDALRSDAKIWDAAAENLNGPLSAMAGLTVTPADVSMWAADLGLHNTYDSARIAVENLLRQATENFDNITNTLRASADTYQREEEASAHTFNHTY